MYSSSSSPDGAVSPDTLYMYPDSVSKMSLRSFQST